MLSHILTSFYLTLKEIFLFKIIKNILWFLLFLTLIIYQKQQIKNIPWFLLFLTLITYHIYHSLQKVSFFLLFLSFFLSCYLSHPQACSPPPPPPRSSLEIWWKPRVPTSLKWHWTLQPHPPIFFFQKSLAFYTIRSVYPCSDSMLNLTCNFNLIFLVAAIFNSPTFKNGRHCHGFNLAPSTIILV